MDWLVRENAKITQRMVRVFSFSALFLLQTSFATEHVAKGTHIFDGDALGQQKEFNFSIISTELALITVSQESADYQLSLFNANNSELVTNVDFSAYLGLDEILIVNASDCLNCVLRLEPKSAIHAESPYSVKIEITDASKNDARAVDSLMSLRSAGEYSYASALENEGREAMSRLALTALDEAAALSMSTDMNLRHHALLSKLQFLFRIGMIEENQSTLRTVLKESERDPTVYRLQALYQLAGFEDDTQTKTAYLNEGMELAKTLSKPTLRAQGLNYQAVNNIYNADFSSAFSLLEKAYELATENKNWSRALDALHNLGWGNLRAGNLPVSISYYTQQKLIAERYQDIENSLWAMYNLALVYGNLGELKIADDFLNQGLKQLAPSENGAEVEYKSLLAHIMLERSQRYLEFGALDNASDHAIDAKALFLNIGRQDRVAKIIDLQADIALALNMHDKAEALYQANLTYYLENSKLRAAAESYLNLAKLYSLKGNYVKAADFHINAFERITKTQDKALLAKALSESVELLISLGLPKDALRIAQDANKLNEQFGHSKDRALFVYRSALAQEALGNFLKAQEELKVARLLLNSQLVKVHQKKLRQQYLGLFKDIYSASIRVAEKLAPHDRYLGLSYAEEYKARTLRESIVDIRSGRIIGQDKLARRNNLLQQIRLRSAQWHFRDQQKPHQLLQEIRRLSLSLQSLEAEWLNIREQAPVEKRELLSHFSAQPGELIMYYFFGTKQSWLWAISEAGIANYSLPAESKISPLVNDYLRTYSVPPSARADVNAWQQQEIAKYLSELLIKPLEPMLARGNISQLSVITDGPIASFPIGALTRTSSNSPLIESYAIRYNASLATQSLLAKQEQPIKITADEKSILIVADPVNINASVQELKPLPYALEEGQAIAQLYGTKSNLLSDSQATRDNFFMALEQKPTIVHIATHGLINNHEPSLSALVFSGNEAGENLLLLPEIGALTIDADLVVLSACDTSVGRQIAGEGALSMSRAFIEAGATQVVGSLWQVQDRATSELMSQFYKGIKINGLNVSQALREAQKSVLRNKNNNWSDPYFWAGIQLMGEA